MSAGGYFFEGVGFRQRDGLPRFEMEVFPFENLGAGLAVGLHVVNSVVDHDMLFLLGKWKV